MTGNCLKGSRPLLYFDPGFDLSPQHRIAKELLSQVPGYAPQYFCCVPTH